MKLHLLIGAVALAMVGAEAMAQCAANSRVGNLQQLLPGNTLCAERGNDKWQEQHRGNGTSGELWDYKRGGNDLIDPTKKVGTWSISGQGQGQGQGNQQVTYAYTNGPSFTFTVHEADGGLYNFCASGTSSITGARIINGITSCEY